MDRNIYIEMDKKHYKSDDVISGIVHIQLKSSMKVKYVELCISKNFVVVMKNGSHQEKDSKEIFRTSTNLLENTKLSSGHHTFPFTFTLRTEDSSCVKVVEKYKNKCFKVYNGYSISCIIKNASPSKSSLSNRTETILDKFPFRLTGSVEILPEKKEEVKNPSTSKMALLFGSDSVDFIEEKPACGENDLEYSTDIMVFDSKDFDVLTKEKVDLPTCLCFFNTKVEAQSVTNKQSYFSSEPIILFTKLTSKPEIFIHSLKVKLVQLFSVQIGEKVYSFTKVIEDKSESSNIGNDSWRTRMKIPRETPSTVDEAYLKISYFLRIEISTNRSKAVGINKPIEIFSRNSSHELPVLLDVLKGVDYPSTYVSLA